MTERTICTVCGMSTFMDEMFKHGDSLVSFSMSGRITVHNVDDPERVIDMLGKIVGYDGPSRGTASDDIGSRCRSEIWDRSEQVPEWHGSTWNRAQARALTRLREAAR